MAKMEVSSRQRANALEARDVMWPSVPAENVTSLLSQWRLDAADEAPTCGTVACFGGWCAWWPHFQAQGIQSDHLTGAPRLNGEWGTSMLASERLFGDSTLFLRRNDHSADAGFIGTDHELVTHRLNWLIENSVVV